MTWTRQLQRALVGISARLAKIDRERIKAEIDLCYDAQGTAEEAGDWQEADELQGEIEDLQDALYDTPPPEEAAKEIEFLEEERRRIENYLIYLASKNSAEDAAP